MKYVLRSLNDYWNSLRYGDTIEYAPGELLIFEPLIDLEEWEIYHMHGQGD